MFNKLTCNYRKCRKLLDQIAVVCSCSHIFCEEHCPTNFGATNVKCLACKTSLSHEKMDIIPVDLNPNERFKSMVLAGQRPEIIMDISSRALAFWMYQSQQEIDYNLYINKRLSEKCKSVEEDCRNLVAMLQREKRELETELQRINKKCEEMRENLIELTQRHQQMELELKSRRSRSEMSCSSDQTLDGPEKKRSSHGISTSFSFRCSQSGQGEAQPQLKRSRGQPPQGTMHVSRALNSGFQKPFFGAPRQCQFVSPDSTRVSPANQHLCPSAWMASQLGSTRSDPGSASIAAHFAARKGKNSASSQRPAISSAFGCVPGGMKP